MYEIITKKKDKIYLKEHFYVIMYGIIFKLERVIYEECLLHVQP